MKEIVVKTQEELIEIKRGKVIMYKAVHKKDGRYFSDFKGGICVKNYLKYSC